MASEEEVRKAKPGEKVCAKEGCPLITYKDSTKCKCHGGALEMQLKNKNEMKNYILSKCVFRKNITDKANNKNGHSLRDEIGITRFMLESLLENIVDENDLQTKQLQIGGLVLKIERLVLSSIKAEVQLGELLSADILMLVMQQIIAIISKHIKDTNILDTIATEISKIKIEQNIVEDESMTELDIL